MFTNLLLSRGKLTSCLVHALGRGKFFPSSSFGQRVSYIYSFLDLSFSMFLALEKSRKDILNAMTGMGKGEGTRLW